MTKNKKTERENDKEDKPLRMVDGGKTEKMR